MTFHHTQDAPLDVASQVAISAPVAPDVPPAVALMKKHFFAYGKVNNALECVEQIRKYGGAGTEYGASQSCMLIVGEAGSGKSATINHWMRKHYLVEVRDFEEVPFLYVETPSHATQKTLCEEILYRLGAPVMARKNRASLLAQVRYFLTEMKVQVLFIDEVQNMLSERSSRLNQEAADTVKYILNSGVCGVVMSGLPDSRMIFTDDSQLTRRRRGVFHFQGCRWDEDEAPLYQLFLESFESLMPIPPVRGFFDDPDLSERIHFASEGFLGRTADLLCRVTTHGLAKGANILNRELFADCLEAQRDGFDEGWVNPFHGATLDRTRPVPPVMPNRRLGLRRGNRRIREADVL